MPQGEVRSLWHGLSAAGGPGGRVLSDASAAVRLEDLARGTSLGLEREAFRGRSVLLAVKAQLPAALAMIELDGTARRMVLCPADVPEAHVAAIMEAAEVDAAVCDAGDRPPRQVPLVAASTPRLEPASAPGGETARTEWILLTSGTTGVPKLVVHDRASLGGPALSGAPLGRGAVWSTFYDIRRYGGVAIFFRALLGGGSLVLSSAEEATASFLARAGAGGVTHISGTPSHWRRALMSPAAREFAPRYVRLSGEIADQPILDQLRAVFPGVPIAHAFASTEAGLAFEVNDGRAGFPADLIGREGEVALRVIDGTLRIRSPRTGKRYLGPGAPPLADEEGFVDTGDVVELRGDRYYFVGRRDGIVNVGGFKVNPEEVEAVINAHPQVRMSLVKARKSPITGAVVVADIVPAAGADPDTLEREILETCRRRLTRHKVPASIRFVDALAVAPSGKLKRQDA